MNFDDLPIDVSISRAKREILQAINQIGNSYGLPSVITTIIVDQIVKESTLNAYETIIRNYDIEIPEGVNTQKKEPAKTELYNDDVHLKAVDV